MTIQEKTAQRIYELLPYKKAKCNKWGDVLYEPIRLANILLAIGNEKLEWLYDEDTLVVLRLVTSYNLSQDNLLNQSDEFCEMILGLLGY